MHLLLLVQGGGPGPQGETGGEKKKDNGGDVRAHPTHGAHGRAVLSQRPRGGLQHHQTAPTALIAAFEPASPHIMMGMCHLSRRPACLSFRAAAPSLVLLRPPQDVHRAVKVERRRRRVEVGDCLYGAAFT
jgi:hypothetical protein